MLPSNAQFTLQDHTLNCCQFHALIQVKFVKLLTALAISVMSFISFSTRTSVNCAPVFLLINIPGFMFIKPVKREKFLMLNHG